MLSLCQRTFKLFRRHPVLWLPYGVAELLAVFLWRQRTVAQEAVFTWFTTEHSTSVLGGTEVTRRLDSETQHRVLLVFAAVSFTTKLICVVLFVVAYVLTARMIENLRAEREFVLADALAALADRWRPILLFAVFVLVAFTLLMMGIVIPATYLLHRANHAEYASSVGMIMFELLVVTGIVAWLLMPMAIRLVQCTPDASISTSLRWKGTACAVAAMELETVLGALVRRMESKAIFDSHAQVAVVTAANNLVCNLPDVLLFIALALLAESRIYGEITPASVSNDNVSDDVMPA